MDKKNKKNSAPSSSNLESSELTDVDNKIKLLDTEYDELTADSEIIKPEESTDADNKTKLLYIEEDDELTAEEEKAIDRDVEHFQKCLEQRWPERMQEILCQGAQRRPSKWITDTLRRLNA